MAVAGTWSATNLRFSGSGKWGTGINPIHGVRDNGRADDILVSHEQPRYDYGGHVPAQLEETEDWGYCAGDYMSESGAGLRMVDDRPGWGRQVDRSDLPANYPEPGEPGAGEDWRNVPHHSAEEAQATINVFQGGVAGGWLNKARGQVNRPVTSDPRQYEINTSMAQGAGVGVMRNDRAVARGLPARSPIESRTAGMIVKSWARSFEQGGGPGTPRMVPFQQSTLKRPFYFRTAGLPPPEAHMMNTAEGRVPLQYVPPDNPPMGADATAGQAGDYGYTDAGEWY